MTDKDARNAGSRRRSPGLRLVRDLEVHRIMSRIGRLPIPVPAGVTVTVDEDNLVTVKGPKGDADSEG